MTKEDFEGLGFSYKNSGTPRYMSTVTQDYILEFRGHCEWTVFRMGSKEEGVPEIMDWTLIESVEQVTRLMAACDVPLAVAALRRGIIDEILTDL